MSVAPWPLQVLHTVGFPGVEVVVSADIGALAGAAALLRGSIFSMGVFFAWRIRCAESPGVSSTFLRGAIIAP
jgi:hypothetical protein